jgi:hypothetical protein
VSPTLDRDRRPNHTNHINHTNHTSTLASNAMSTCCNVLTPVVTHVLLPMPSAARTLHV